MKRNLFLLIGLLFTLIGPKSSVLAQGEEQILSDVPFEGYYIAPEDHAIEGLLFEENQLLIYIKDQQDLTDQATGLEKSQWLTDFHSFPYPDLSNYSEGVRERYLSEDNLPYDLQADYEEITSMITPEMSQLDILNLINNRIPGIYYTEKDGYAYYTIANPTVLEEEDAWNIQLFGEELFVLEEVDGKLQDQDGITYKYLAGITPN
ncbi:hypothetical protein [Ruoffia sp. FAM 26255]|uniref:hypothetical protein n=1 Tax=Ruoffia sp. FAM 26255 TaxID=3259519 RepID=UPI003885C5E2